MKEIIMKERTYGKGKFRCFGNIGMSSIFWIRAWILISLSKGNSYGYELINGIIEAFPEWSSQTPGVMGNYYRILRMLEAHGLIESQWDTSGSGPAKRIYSITPRGIGELENIFRYIKQTKEFVSRFIGYIEEKEVK